MSIETIYLKEKSGNFFTSSDGFELVPFSKVIRIRKFVDDGYLRVYYGEQVGFEDYFICSPFSQLEFYLNWLNKNTSPQ